LFWNLVSKQLTFILFFSGSAESNTDICSGRLSTSPAKSSVAPGTEKVCLFTVLLKCKKKKKTGTGNYQATAAGKYFDASG